MKNLILVSSIALSALLPSSSVFAANKCERAAVKLVKSKYGSYFYKRGFQIRDVSFVQCKASGAKVVCEVSADSVNDDCGSVTFSATLDKACEELLDHAITGEE